MLEVMYVGETGNFKSRINNHVFGNIESSVLRYHVAEMKRYKIKKTNRPKSTPKVQIVDPDSRIGEKEINLYISSGKWKFVECFSKREARDCKWYIIEKMRPKFNVQKKEWDRDKEDRFAFLYRKLSECPEYTYDQIIDNISGPGILVFLH